MATSIRYAYIKSGDVVDELQRIGPAPAIVPDGGPDAYIAGLLQMTGEQPTLLLSSARRDAILRIGNVEARVYRHDSKFLRPVGTVAIKVWIFFSALVHMLRFRPDRILCGRRKGALLWAGFIVSRLLSKPFVYSCHCQVKPEGRSWHEQCFLNMNFWILRHASAVICHGPYLTTHLMELGIPSNRLYEFNAGYQDMFSITTEVNKIPRKIGDCKNQIILFVGRVQPNKGVFDLLDACTDRLLIDSKLSLVYVGDGSHLNELQKRVAERGLNKKVRCMGRVPHDAVGDIILQSKFLVTPTRSTFPEGRCMAAVEGLVMGVPVIAPNFGPFPYLIKHGVNGLLFRTNSVDDLKSKITSLLEDDDLYNRLCLGAKECAKNLVDPALIFRQAVERAFASEVK